MICIRRKASRGNVLFMILLAILLLSALTFAITSSDKGGDSLSRERTNIAASNVGSFATDIRRAVDGMLRGGRSETTISFAESHLTGYGTADSNAKAEVFNIAGGGATYTKVPDSMNNGSQWEFIGTTRAPGVGDDATPDLMMVLPNVNEKFCRAYNQRAGYDYAAAIPTDTDACLYDTAKRFAGSFATGSDINEMDASTFRKPATFACVVCDDNTYHAYYVLIER